MSIFIRKLTEFNTPFKNSCILCISHHFIITIRQYQGNDSTFIKIFIKKTKQSRYI